GELFAGLAERAAGRNGEGATREVAGDMRYVGQEHTITIPMRSEDGVVVASLDEIRDAFTREHQKTFGHEMEEEAEIVSLRATLRTPLPRRAAGKMAVASGGSSGESSVQAYSFTRREWLDFRIVQRSSLEPGAELAGPAILLEETATTYLDAGF